MTPVSTTATISPLSTWPTSRSCTVRSWHLRPERGKHRRSQPCLARSPAGGCRLLRSPHTTEYGAYTNAYLLADLLHGTQ